MRSPDRDVAAWHAHPSWGRVPLLDLDEPVDCARLVVVAAHPDDESIGAGGLIARAHARGIVVYLALLTAGEAADPAVTDGSRHALARLRLAEMEEAVALLAPGTPVVFLGVQDARVADCEDPIASYLTETLGEGDHPARTLVAAPWRHDDNPDHRAAGRAAARACEATGARLVEFPVRLWLDATPTDAPWDSMAHLELDPDEQKRKASAIAAHASQFPHEVLEGRLAHLVGPAEHYVVGPPPGEAGEADEAGPPDAS